MYNSKPRQLRRSVGTKTFVQDAELEKKKSSRRSIASFIFGIKTSSSHSLTSVESNDSIDENVNSKTDTLSVLNANSNASMHILPAVEVTNPTSSNPAPSVTLHQRKRLPRKDDIEVEPKSVEAMRLHLLESSGAIQTRQASFKEHKITRRSERIICALSLSSSPELISFTVPFNSSPSPAATARVLRSARSYDDNFKADIEVPVRASTVYPQISDNSLLPRASLPTALNAALSMEKLPDRAAEMRRVRQTWVARIV